MIIKPGVNSPSSVDMIEVVRQNGKRYIDVLFTDDQDNPVDISETRLPNGEPDGELDLEIVDSSNNVLFSETYWPTYVPSNRRITNPSTGKYQIKWGVNDDETQTAGPLLANWHIRQNSTGEDFYRTQVIDVVSPQVLRILPYFRLQIDKSVKVVYPEEWCFIGYSDAQLIMFLELGLSRINSAQPYPYWSNLGSFDIDAGMQILIRAALVEGLRAQYLFAVDTDVPSYSDSGHSFVIQHGPQIKSMIDSLDAQLDRDIQAFKLHYVGVGRVSTELRVGTTFYQLISSAPFGALFARTFTSLG